MNRKARQRLLGENGSNVPLLFVFSGYIGAGVSMLAGAPRNSIHETLAGYMPMWALLLIGSPLLYVIGQLVEDGYLGVQVRLAAGVAALGALGVTVASTMLNRSPLGILAWLATGLLLATISMMWTDWKLLRRIKRTRG